MDQCASRGEEDYMRKTAPEKYHKDIIPDFEVACKRRIMDTGYLASLHSPNLHLTSEPIVAITPTGIRTAQDEYPVDVIVFATGFNTEEFIKPMKLSGRGGVTLDEHWKELGGPGAYNCTAVHGFPNFFMVMGPNAGTGHTSALMAAENTIEYAIKVMGPVVSGRAETVEISEKAERKWVETIQEELKHTVWNTGCRTVSFSHHPRGSLLTELEIVV